MIQCNGTTQEFELTVTHGPRVNVVTVVAMKGDCDESDGLWEVVAYYTQFAPLPEETSEVEAWVNGRFPNRLDNKVVPRPVSALTR